MTGHVRRRSVAAYVVLGGVLLATVGPTSGAAHPERDRHGLDTTSSAHPSSVRPSVRDDAFAEGATRDREVEADATGTSSATCDGCAAESTTLQVLYVSRARAARLDNAAVAWTQSCRECTATSLSVQVVVLRGRPTVVPNNRALALNAACAACRTASAAFQLVVVADRAERLSEQSPHGAEDVVRRPGGAAPRVRRRPGRRPDAAGTHPHRAHDCTHHRTTAGAHLGTRTGTHVGVDGAPSRGDGDHAAPRVTASGHGR